MEKKINYVYITTNLINGKQYIGDHSTNKLEDDYLGSGRPYFKRAINEYGSQNFKKEILEFFQTKQEAFNAQEKYIMQFNTLTPNGYNISPKGGLNVKGCHSKETKRKIGESNKIAQNGKKRSEESKQKQSLSRINKTFIDLYGEERAKEIKNKIGNKNKISLKGKKQTPEHIKNSAITRIGKHRSEETKLKISIKETRKIVSDETRKKQSESQSKIQKELQNKPEVKERKRKAWTGINNPSSKLTNIQINEIKELCKTNISVKQIALKYNVCVGTIYKYKSKDERTPSYRINTKLRKRES